MNARIFLTSTRRRLGVAFACALFSFLSARPVPAVADVANGVAATPLADLAGKALWNYPESADVAIQALRAAGPAGIDALLAADRTRGDRTIDDAEFGQVLDRVCAQRDCAASHLYWYTDLDAARAAAQAEGKPILSLRLLGRLDEEFSCANSRFFRTVLYADPQISRLLRERFILHWQSVRPVPKITIDMGDGRSLSGTITGNSIHYVLDSRGRLLDALPGLLGPAAFLRDLTDLDQVAAVAAGLEDAALAWLSSQRHGEQARLLSGTLSADLDRYQKWLRGPARHRAGKAEAQVVPAELAGDPPTAVEASTLAMSKGGIEMRFLNVLFPPTPGAQWGADIPWAGVANYHRADWQLDDAARERLRQKMALGAGPEAERMAANFESLLSLDTVRNELGLHAVLHDWLAGEVATVDLDAFNERVYAELFLTPSSDPWLGLNPEDVFTGLAPRMAVIDRER
ncbi:MAG TPA: hypothetical protein VGS22_08870 [Thermoanaerobaculia bacterium]|jgi:hypothetical protein|nr:hypothetical protein [Thermoanaerobaculia bacterium]